MRPSDHRPFTTFAVRRWVFVAFLAANWFGCEKPPAAKMAPAKVGISQPVVRSVVEWDEYTARLEAIESVEVRARISGYLETIAFKDGAMVEAGDVLFVIDPRPFQAALRQSDADVALAKARLELAQKRFQRTANLVEKKAMSKEEADTRAAEAHQAEASVRAAEAAREASQLNLEYTTVRAPVGGRVGRKLVTKGNLINGSGAQGTLLTTIVSLDPIYAYFEADERAYLKYTALAREGRRPSSRDARNPVQIGFGDEVGFPHQGEMDFVDNQLDPDTGTITARAVLANPDLSLSPGLFARLRLVGSSEYEAVLIPDAAVGHDQSQTFVFVLNDKNEPQRQTVMLGPVIDGRRVVRSGLKGTEQIVVSGIQRVRAGAAVEPIPQPIEAAASPTPASPKGGG